MAPTVVMGFLLTASLSLLLWLGLPAKATVRPALPTLGGPDVNLSQERLDEFLRGFRR